MASIFDFLNAVDPNQTMPRDQGTMFEMLQRQFNGTPGMNVGAPPSPQSIQNLNRALPPQPAPPPSYQSPATPPTGRTMFAGGEQADMGAMAGGSGLPMPPQGAPQMPSVMQSGGGMLDGLHNFVLQNRGALAGMGAAIQQGRPVGYGALQGAEIDKKRKDEEEEKQREKNFVDAAGPFLKDNPFLYNMMRANPKMAPALIQMAQTEKGRNTLTEFQRQSLAIEREKTRSGGGDKAGLNAIYGVRDGKPVIMQLHSGGGVTEAKLPEGVELSKEPIRLDAGTHWVLMNPLNGQQVGIVPKNIEEATAAKERGELGGQTAAGAPAALDAADQALTQIKEIRESPALGRSWQGTGMGSIGNLIPGTEGYNLRNRVNQVKSGAFLTAIQQMKGLGALSNAEGERAGKAIERIDLATTDDEFKKALSEYENVIKLAQQRIRNNQAKYGGGTAGQPAADSDGWTTLPGGARIREVK